MQRDARGRKSSQRTVLADQKCSIGTDSGRMSDVLKSDSGGRSSISWGFCAGVGTGLGANCGASA